MNSFEQLVESPLGALAFLVVAAFLEAFGDSFFQAGFYRATGWWRLAAIVAGAVVLAVVSALKPVAGMAAVSNPARAGTKTASFLFDGRNA